MYFSSRKGQSSLLGSGASRLSRLGDQGIRVPALAGACVDCDDFLLITKEKTPTCRNTSEFFVWRRHPDLNRGSRICSPMPYHLAMAPSSGDARSASLSADGLCPRRKVSHPLPPPSSQIQNYRFVFVIKGAVTSRYMNFCSAEQKKWSGRRGSNSLPPPWQGGALPDELRPHIARGNSISNFVTEHNGSNRFRFGNELPPDAIWCLRSESNQRHADFQSAALPSELQRHIC